MKLKYVLSASLLCAATSGFSVPLLAQGGATELEEVIVSAQRREENLQDVPISVSVFSGAQIEEGNIKSAIDYLALTPNVSFTEDGQTGSRGLGIAVRGINNLVSGENAFVNSVGIYLDEFSVASVPNQVANPMLPDMARVEVLRGPQGTYFGRNSLGGALNLVTNKPTDELEGMISVGAESYDDAGEMYSVTGVVNVPVTDSFRLRAVGYYEDSDGYVENICAKGASPSACPGAAENGYTPSGAGGSAHEYAYFRVHADFDISDRTSLLATLIYSDEDQDTDENVPSGVLDVDSIDTFGISSAVDPGTGFWPNNRNKLSHDRDEFTRNESTVFILNLTHEINESNSLKWITGFIDAETTREFDNDLVGGMDAVRRDNTYDGESWSTELRFDRRTDVYDMVIGAMYADDEQKQDNLVHVGTQATATISGVGILPPFPYLLGLAKNNKEWSVESVSLFADFTYHVSDTFDVIFGGRFTRDKVSNSLAGFGIAPGINPGDFWSSWGNFARDPVNTDSKYTGFSPRLVLKYAASDDLNLYANISKGYKAGGNSVGNDPRDGSGIALPFNKEELWNYEVGFKSVLMDGNMRLNGSFFFLDWEDLQVETFRFLAPGDLSSNFEQTTSVEEAEAMGMELEMLYAVHDQLTFSASVGMLDTEITSDTSAEITGGFIVELQGLELPKAPELTFNLALDYRFDLGGNDAWIRGEFIHRDGQFSDVEALTYLQTDGPSPNQGLARNSVGTFGDFPFRTPDYDVINIRGGVDFGNVSLVLYVQNLADKEYYTGTQENFGVSGFRLRPHPRVIGGSLTYNF